MERIFITGASRGIGKGLALKYAKLGANVFLTATNLELLTTVYDEIKSFGGTAWFRKCDVRNPDDMQAAVDEAIEKMGGIDIAFLNAAINGRITYSNINAKIFKDIINTNFFGVLNGISSLVPYMLTQNKGTIVGISSLADFRSIPSSSPYNISKIALSYLLDSARVDLKPYGIDVITVRPGFTKTDFISYNKFYMPFLMELDDCVERIYRGVTKNKKIISFPLTLAIGSSILKLIPTTIWDYLIGLWDKKYGGE